MAIKHRLTIGNLFLLEIDADPRGSLIAAKGTVAIDSVNAKIWVNQNGAGDWRAL